MDAALPFNLRVRSRLLRDGAYAELEALAAFEAQLRARARARRVKGNGKHLFVRLEARLQGRQPFVFRREGDRVLWVPPEPLRGALGPEQLDVTDALADAAAEVHLRSPLDGSEYLVPSRSELRLEPRGEGDELRAVLTTTAWITPTTAAGGGPLRPGEWEVYATLDVAGFRRGRRVKRRGEPLSVTALSPARVAAGRKPLPRPTLRGRVARRFPRPVRRTLAAAAGAVRR